MDDEFKILIGAILDENAKGNIQGELDKIKDLSIAISKATLDESAIESIRQQLMGHGIDASVLLKDNGSLAGQAQKMGENAGRNMKQGMEKGMSAGKVQWNIDTKTYEAQIADLASRLSRFGEESGDNFKLATDSLEDMRIAYEGMLNSGDEEQLVAEQQRYQTALQTTKSLLTELKADRETKIEINIDTEKYTSQISQVESQLSKFGEDSGESFSKATASLAEANEAYQTMLTSTGDERIEAENRFQTAIETSRNCIKQLQADSSSASAQMTATLSNIQIGIDTEKYSSQLSQLESQLSKFGEEDGAAFQKATASINEANEAYQKMLNTNGDQRIEAEQAFQQAIDTTKNSIKQLQAQSTSASAQMATALSDIQLGIDTEKYSTQLAQLESQLSKFGEEDGAAFQKATASINEATEAYEKMLNTNGDERINAEKAFQQAIETTRNEVKQLQAETTSASAQMATEMQNSLATIQFNIDTEKYSAEISQLTASLSQFGTASGEAFEKTAASLEEVKAAYNEILTTDGQARIDAEEKYQQALKTTKNLLKDLRSDNSSKVASSDNTQRLNLIKQMNTYLEKNTAITKENKAQVEAWIATLSSSDDMTVGALKNIQSQFKQLQIEIDNTGQKGLSFGDQLSKIWKSFSGIGLAGMASMKAMQAIRSIPQTVRDVNTAQTELIRVTTATDNQLARFWDDASVSAKLYGTTISDYISTAADWTRLGYNIDDAKELADATALLQKVGTNMTQESASNGMISVLRGFQLEADEAMHIVDVMNEIANTEPIDTAGLFEGLERSASALSAANNSLEESVALITTANSVVQNPEAVGTAFKTITMRIRAAKTEMEEAGLDTEGMATSVASLRKEMLALTGVDIMIDDNTFKSTYDILDELSTKWQDLTDIQQASVIDMLAGKRQSNIMNALMTNFDIARETLDTALNGSVGSAERELGRWNNSIDASFAHFSASFQSLATNILSSDLIKAVVDMGTTIVNVFDTIFNKLGSFNVALIGGGLIALLTQLEKFRNVGEAINFSKMFEGADTVSKQALVAFQALGAEQQKLVLSTATLTEKQREQLLGVSTLTAGEAQHAAAVGAMAGAEGMATTATTTLTGAIHSLTTALASNPLFWVAGGALAIYGIIKAVDYFTISLDEAKDAAQEAGESYQGLADELSNLNEELKTNQSRMDELESKGDLTFVEQEELDRLKETNAELERQIKNEEILAGIERDKARESQSQALNTQTESVMYTGYTPVSENNDAWANTGAQYQVVSGTWLEVAETEVKAYQGLVERKKELDKEMADMEMASPDDSYLDTQAYQDLANEFEAVDTEVQRLKSDLAEFGDKAGGYVSIFDEEEDKETIDRINGVIDTFHEVDGIGVQTAQDVTEAFNNIWDNPDFESYKERLLELAEAGELSPETLSSNDEYKRLLNETGMTAEQVCSHIKALNKEAGEIGGSSTTSGIKNTIDSLDKLGSNLKNVTKLYESFQKAGKSGFSNSDISALLSQTEELAGVDLEGFIDTLTDVGSTEEDIQKAFDDLTTEIIVQRGIVDEINEANAAYVEEQLLAQGVTIDYSMAISEATMAETDKAMTDEWMNAVTAESIDQLFAEIGVTDAAADSFYGYVAAKLTDFVFYTGGDIEQLSAVIGALSEGANAWYQYYAARAQADAASAKAEQYRQRGKYTEAESMDRVAANYMKDAESYKISAQAIEAKTTTPVAPGGSGGGGGSGGKGGGGGGGGGSGSGSEPKETEFDWMEQKIDVLDEQIDKLQDKIDTLVGYKNKNAVTDTVLDVMAEKMETLQQMYDRYMEEADKIGLSSEYIDKIQNGLIDVETIADETLSQMISDYQGWYDKAKDVEDRIKSTKKSIKELNLSKLDNIIDQFEDLADIQSQIVDTQEKLLDWYTESGIEDVEIDNYLSLGERQLKIAEDNYKAYKTLSKEMKSMNLQAGTEEWKKYNDQLQTFKNNMLSAASAVEEYKDSMKDLVYKELNDFADAMDSINGTISTMQTLIGSTNLVDEAGNLTDLGLTQVALYAQTMQTSQQLTAEYAEAIKSLDEALDEGLINQDEYNELLYEYISAQEDAITATKEAKDAILDLVKEGMQAEIDNMRTLTDEAIAALEAEQDLYEYQKSINEQQSNIVTLQKKIAALSNATTGTELATRLQLEQELADAEAELYDTEYEHSIEVQKQALEDAYDAYEEEKNAEMDELDSNLAAQDAAIEKYLQEVEDDYQTVYSVLIEYGDEYSLYAIDALTAPWDSSRDAANLCADAMGDVCAQISYDIESIDISPLYDMIEALQTIASYGYGGGYGEGYYPDVTNQGTWQKNSTGWWYGNSDDDYVSGGYYNINGTTYGFNDNGYMITGWDDSQGEWSYFDSSGAMVKSDWAKDKNGDWYYLTSTGQMARDAAIRATDGSGYYYYVDSNGKWDGRYLTAADVMAAGYSTAYKSGTKSAQKGVALINEEGPEVVATNEGTLKQFDGGETVFSNDMVRNLWDFANNPSTYLGRIANNAHEATGREPMEVHYSPSVVVEGSADEKTIEALQNVMHEQMVDFTQKELFSVVKRAGITYRR